MGDLMLLLLALGLIFVAGFIIRVLIRTDAPVNKVLFSGSVSYEDRGRIEKGLYVEHGVVWDSKLKRLIPQRKRAANFFETVI